ncbi:MAG: efflux RND transporter periplasmic adaptor subunit [Bacteroidetes bacterium]|nr:MAG: efflux RND transporter periplasmic adaptor subunit [Bacteroidota bacterium]
MYKVLYIAILIFLSACSSEPDTSNPVSGATETENIVVLSEAQNKSAGIKFSTIEQRSISSILKVNGIIDVPPQNMVSVSMPLGGYLKTTKLLPGMHIAKGEVIATMEDQLYIQLQQEYLTAKSKLQFAEAEYERQKELNQTKASSDKVYQQALMEYKNHKIALSALTEKLKLINITPENLTESNLSKNINIYSSIDGFVSKVNVNIGKYVNPSDILFELVNPDDIHLNMKVYEKDLGKLSVGQKLVAYTNDQPELRHPCEIILISKNVNNDRSIEVHCHFMDYDKALIPGMYMNAEVEILSKNTYSIQEDAVVNFEAKKFLFVQIADKKFEMIPVETGTSEGGFTEILNPEELQTKNIVVKGAYTLLMVLKNKEEE